jgi:hypothetical protein
MAVFHGIDNFSSGFIAQISYLEEKMQKFRKIPLGGIWGEFWDILGNFLVFGIISTFNIFLFFINIKKMFEKKIKGKTMNYTAHYVFFTFCFSGLLNTILKYLLI